MNQMREANYFLLIQEIFRKNLKKMRKYFASEFYLFNSYRMIKSNSISLYFIKFGFYFFFEAIL
jgi:hypothetical protein